MPPSAHFQIVFMLHYHACSVPFMGRSSKRKVFINKDKQLTSRIELHVLRRVVIFIPSVYVADGRRWLVR